MKFLRRLLGRVTVSTPVRGAPPQPQEASPARATEQLHLGAPHAGGAQRMRGRLSVIGLVIAGGFAIAGARAVEVAVFTPEPPARIAATHEPEARRAMILDRDGEILASTLDFHTVFVDPGYVWDAQEVVDRLATVLPDIDRDRLLRQLNSDTRYVPIASGVSPRTRQAIHMLGLAGVFFSSEPGRVYPKQRAASHVVGFAGRGGHGLTGAELAFDAELRDGAGPVYLSIDLTAQHRVESVLRRRMAEFQAAGASATLMRVGTGEVLAMASLPDFDINHYQSIDVPPAGSERVDPRLNQAASRVYELGSVFKPLALAAGLEAGRVRLDDMFDAAEPVRIGGHTIHDYRGQERALSAREVILYSSNIGAARMADQIGGEVLSDFYRDLRLFEAAPIELAESRAPVLPRRWGRIQTMTAAYGHGLEVSPLALTAAYAALANGGVYVAPTLRPVAPGEVVVGEPVMSPAVAAQVLGVLRENVVRSQTGSADIPGLAVAGKTGTAERVVDRAYVEGSYFNTFVAVFPFDDPQYVLTVTLDRPQPTADTHGFATAGWTAMPTAGEIIAELDGVLDLPRRESDPAARASAVAAMFAPRGPVRAPVEEPVALGGAGR
jgi:cell division protein FtsI (penicillin-binding protein 3)